MFLVPKRTPASLNYLGKIANPSSPSLALTNLAA
jgi:hypothetical protein